MHRWKMSLVIHPNRAFNGTIIYTRLARSTLGTPATACCKRCCTDYQALKSEGKRCWIIFSLRMVSFCYPGIWVRVDILGQNRNRCRSRQKIIDCAAMVTDVPRVSAMPAHGSALSMHMRSSWVSRYTFLDDTGKAKCFNREVLCKFIHEANGWVNEFV